MTKPRTPDAIRADMLVAIREAVEPFEVLTDAEIEARTDLPPPMARLLVAWRKIVRENDDE